MVEGVAALARNNEAALVVEERIVFATQVFRQDNLRQREHETVTDEKDIGCRRRPVCNGIKHRMHLRPPGEAGVPEVEQVAQIVVGAVHGVVGPDVPDVELRDRSAELFLDHRHYVRCHQARAVVIPVDAATGKQGRWIGLLAVLEQAMGIDHVNPGLPEIRQDELVRATPLVAARGQDTRGDMLGVDFDLVGGDDQDECDTVFRKCVLQRADLCRNALERSFVDLGLHVVRIDIHLLIQHVVTAGDNACAASARHLAEEREIDLVVGLDKAFAKAQALAEHLFIL